MSFVEVVHLGAFLKENPVQEERNHCDNDWEFFSMKRFVVGGYVHADISWKFSYFTYDGNLA